jgi:hypothetical protein
VPVKAVRDEAEIVTLAPEAKHLTDTIKMVAYRAETALVRGLTPHDARTEDDGRALLREMLLTSADLLPQTRRSSIAGPAALARQSSKQRRLGETL